MTEGIERRGEHRLDEKIVLFIETENDSDEGNIIICKTIDVSANGLQFSIDSALPEGAIYRICAQFTNQNRQLYLIAEVRWCRRVDNLFQVGVSLFDSEDSDIIEWKTLIAELLT